VIRPGLASVPFLVVGFAACADLTSPLPLPPPPAVATAIVSETASYNFGGRELELRDLPRVRFHLPPVPRPYDFDNPARVAAIAAAGGRAMIGLRAPGATRGLQTGVREAITAAEVRTALLALEAEVEMLHVFPRLGQVHARLDPTNAPRIRHLPFVDWVEPMSTYRHPVARPRRVPRRLQLHPHPRLFTGRSTWSAPSRLGMSRGEPDPSCRSSIPTISTLWRGRTFP
jgi:hypothetical protein